MTWMLVPPSTRDWKYSKRKWRGRKVKGQGEGGMFCAKEADKFASIKEVEGGEGEEKEVEGWKL